MVSSEVLLACKNLLVQSDNIDLFIYTINNLLGEEGEDMSDIVNAPLPGCNCT